MTAKNKKSDVKAKEAYREYLLERGYYDVEIISSPSDIIAYKDGQAFYFEIKMTKQADVYFGAATLTEWIQAFKTPEHYWFVVAKTDDNEEEFYFKEYSPEEFMEYSYIPPFKIFFNINLNDETKKRERKTAIPLTKETMALLIDVHNRIRD